MTVRFFMLQSHYSSTLDFSNEALEAAEKGFKRLTNSLDLAKKLFRPEGGAGKKEVNEELGRLVKDLHLQMSDDFNSAKTLAVLFEMSSRINDLKSGNLPLNDAGSEAFEEFKRSYIVFMEDVLGLKEEAEHNHDLLKGVVNVLIDLRKKARQDRNYALSDRIRDDLKKLGVQLMDGKDGEMSFTIE